MSSEDRRAPGAARIPFEGLVEVGGALGPSFEGKAVNVSEDGMQIRTAYLPDVSQEVTCRFETSPGQSVVASGEVVWSRAADRGGEFGIRFTEVAPDSVELLKRLCGVAADGKPAASSLGSKVRLYIDGLASPMRATVRDAQPTGLTVGSDLAFLRVGKRLDLEGDPTGAKRPANIDRVEVALDPKSQIPQLVVTLRYAEGATAPPSSDARDRARGADRDAFASAPSRVPEALAAGAASVGPIFHRVARRAKATLGLLARRASHEDETIPRRTTAPAPNGGLSSNGRRVVRSPASLPPLDEDGPRPASARRIATATAAVALAGALGFAALKRSHPAADHAGTTTATVDSAASPAASTSASPIASAAPASSTAVPAASPEPATSAAAATAGGTIAAVDDDETGKATRKKQARPAPFGNGPVHHANVLRLRMDGPVQSIEGAQEPTGFVVRIPGRKSLEPAAPLASRDSRIAAIKVENQAGGAELTVTFKDGVPNYQVAARGDTLILSIAPPGPVEPAVATRSDRGQRAPKHGRRHHRHAHAPSSGTAPKAAHAKDATPGR